MKIQYYKTAWGDIKNSPGWFGKLCLLALINFIPVFGQIVTGGYLYGWAREIAWGTRAPLGARIFNNDDGKFWRRGWFIFVLGFVFALLPMIITSIGSAMQSAGVVVAPNGAVHSTGNPVVAGFGTLIYFIGFLLTFFMMILRWIGSMRIAIYDRLSAGFQFGKLWKMLRHDTSGIMRIFGMYLLVGIILGIILSIIISILAFIVIFAGVSGLINAGYTANALQHMTQAQAVQLLWQFIASAGVVGFFAFVIGAYLTALSTLFIDMLVVRALGYWTMQFDVPNWHGQDDPMPFETMPKAQQPAPGQPYMGQPPAAQPFVAPMPGQPMPGQPMPGQPMPVQAVNPYAEQPMQQIPGQAAPYQQQMQAGYTAPVAATPESGEFAAPVTSAVETAPVANVAAAEVPPSAPDSVAGTPLTDASDVPAEPAPAVSAEPAAEAPTGEPAEPAVEAPTSEFPVDTADQSADTAPTNQ